MSAAALTTGFFGKIPATGDFVSRRLPADFVSSWDRWISRHLVPLLDSGVWQEDLSLRFLTGRAAFHPAAGIILPSTDRIGRRFPLCIAALVPAASAEIVSSGKTWFTELEKVGLSARTDRLTPGQLESSLRTLPTLSLHPTGDVVNGMVMWTPKSGPFDVSIDDPRLVVEHLMASATNLC